MICRECGTDVADEAVFCQQCGVRLAGDNKSVQTAVDRLRATSDALPRDDNDPEDEVWQGTYSHWAMFGTWIVAACVTLALLIGGVITGAAGMAWMGIIGVIVVLWLVLVLWLLYRQLTVHYYLTNQRFVHEKGLLWRTIDRIEMIDIDDVTFQQGPVERLLDVGTIRISSSDRTHPEFQLSGIECVRTVAGQIDDLRRQERHKRGLHIEAV